MTRTSAVPTLAVVGATLLLAAWRLTVNVVYVVPESPSRTGAGLSTVMPVPSSSRMVQVPQPPA